MKQKEILLIGLNHKTAPVEIRERVTFSTTMLRSALTHFDAIHKHGHLDEVSEGVIISTCNRLEVYALVNNPVVAAEEIIEFLGRSTNTSPAEFFKSLYFQKDDGAVTHLLKVATGLDSMVLGEPQILGQITDAYETALSQGAARTVLSALFRKAIETGKRARTETAISINPASISSVAAKLAEQLLGGLKHQHVLLIGSGVMGELAVKSLIKRGVTNITVANRTYANAAQLAQNWGGRAVNFQQLPESLITSDIVISSTGAPHTILNRDILEPSMIARPEKPMFIIDIAVPRDVDPNVRKIPNVHLYDIDDLEQQVDDNMQGRRLEIPCVEQIIEEEKTEFLHWLSSLDVVSTIVDMRQQVEDIRQQELARLFKKLDLDEQAQEMINIMSHRLVKKVLHRPIVNLKCMATNGDSARYTSAARQLFGLSEVLKETDSAVAQSLDCV